MSRLQIEPIRLGLTVSIWLGTTALSAQTEFEREPINYETAPVHDRIQQLAEDLESERVQLQWDERHGWLPAVLKVLDIPPASQTLVFSKTSLQLHRITPSRPRALYFNDDAYVGWVQTGDVLELSAVDRQQGAIFYTMPQQKSAVPKIIRDRGQCIVCHASSRTNSVPGYLVRSVFPSPSGQPHYALGTTTTSHHSDFGERFGGWYVTGTHGTMRHRGNVVATTAYEDTLDREAGANRLTLPPRADPDDYLKPGSDIVALMVLEHQSTMHNLITRASYVARQGLYYERNMNRVLERPIDAISETTLRRIHDAVDDLIRHLLFIDEFSLTSRVQGHSGFTEQFEQLGPFDKNNRCLRQFDMRTRMFKYPCSYLIYSESFTALPPIVRDRLQTRLHQILTGQTDEPDFAQLAASDRQAILEILRETHPWFQSPTGSTGQAAGSSKQ